MSPDLVFERLADQADLLAILDIDRESFSGPWTLQMYEQELANPKTLVVVARLPECRVVAYCAAMMVVDELHINNVAVRRAFRGRRIGRALMDYVLASAAVLGARAATLEVRRANVAARALYGGLGFAEHGVRPRYYSDPADDALILWAEIQSFGTSSDP